MKISEKFDFAGNTADMTDHAESVQGDELQQYNKKIAIDTTQFFMQTLSWTSCGKIYLESLGDESIIYVSVIEEA